jgi:spermidine dehydrogenase
MTDANKNIAGDRAIGTDTSITRRDFLGSTLLASGASLLDGWTPAEFLAMGNGSAAAEQKDDWTGYGGVGEYGRSNGNTYAVMEAGHKMRDGAFDPLPAETIETGETYDCVVVGGGISGLAAALFFQRHSGPDKTCLILEMEGAPVSAAARHELLRWFSGSAADESKFDPPKYGGDESSRKLDAISLEQHMMERYGLSRETIRTFLSPVEGGGSGLGPDALSAFCEYAADLLHPWDDGSGEVVQMFPGGNTTIARLMTKALLPASIEGPATVEGVSRNVVNFAALDASGSRARLRLSATAVSVRHDGDPAKASSLSIAYAKDGKVFRVKARSAVMAGGSWTAKHVIKDLPQAQRNAYAQFYRSPCMMANVAVRNWRFLQKMGITGCRWFDGVGNYFDVRRQAICGDVRPTTSPDDPIALTLKVLYAYPGDSTENQGHRGRGEMLTTSFRDYERRIREQFTEMFLGAGFDAGRDIAGIVLNRWGHAYLNPQPGFFFGKDGKPAPRDVLRAGPFGRITFANTDLAGAMDHRYSILEADRAVRQLLDQVLS